MNPARLPLPGHMHSCGGKSGEQVACHARGGCVVWIQGMGSVSTRPTLRAVAPWWSEPPDERAGICARLSTILVTVISLNPRQAVHRCIVRDKSPSSQENYSLKSARLIAIHNS